VAFYKEIFNERGKSYNLAMEKWPKARDQERRIILDLIKPSKGDIIVDAPAGGGYLSEALYEAEAIPICVEPAKNFGDYIPPHFETHFTDIFCTPLESLSVDKVGSLAGLHHLTREQIQQFFDECFRIMKHGGKIAVADVLKGSDVAIFLNGPVDRWTETGHDGNFFEEGELSEYMRKSGFKNITENHEKFYWSFSKHDDLISFCHFLFGLKKAKTEELAPTLSETLGIVKADGSHLLKWSLIYAYAEK